jgi:hypothetical protein
MGCLATDDLLGKKVDALIERKGGVGEPFGADQFREKGGNPLQQQIREKRRWYHRGYNDGTKGWHAYNDTFIDVTGPLIVWRLNRSVCADSYAQGFYDALEFGPERVRSRWLIWIAVFIGVPVLVLIGLGH